jgi:hypothetical protein
MNRENLNFVFNIFPSDLVNKISAIVINQCTNITINQPIQILSTNSNIIMYSVYDKGLSRSRNLALKYADSDICVLTDDDYVYLPNVVDVISQAYRSIKSADVITFQSLKIENSQSRKKYKNKVYKRKIFEFSSISSSEITFKLSSIKSKSIQFNEKFGLGTTNFCGEEGIFLSECFHSNLKIYHYPSYLCLEPSFTTGYKIISNPILRGKIFSKIYTKEKYLLIFILFLSSLKNYNKYKNNFSFINYFKHICYGAFND